MSKHTHTPGPWEASEIGISDPGPDGVSVFEVCSDRSRVCEFVSEANARLIAAAPNLLEMLIEARAELEFMAANERSDTYNNQRINAAIAKATGESA